MVIVFIYWEGTNKDMAKLFFKNRCRDIPEKSENNKSEKICRERSSSNNRRKTWISRCAVLLVFVTVVASVVFSLSENVASASSAVLWGHKGKENITTISDGEIARFDNDPATYIDTAWGDFIPGGINRVNNKDYLPVKRSSLIDGTGVMDSYTQYVSKNVSVVRYSGGTDSNLGISVNGESFGYIKMDVNPSSGRYLYYSISVESLTDSSGSSFGTFAFDIGSLSNSIIVARSENNNCGGVAYFDSVDAVAEKLEHDGVNRYEYGCIDLKALVNKDSESIKSVYVFGTSKSKVVLNYFVISNTPPTKIDVANGNILFANNVEGDNSPQHITRTYSDVLGKKENEPATATLTLNGTEKFSFENLVIDTNNTPYLYYSFTLIGDNKGPVFFLENGSTHTIAKKGGSDAITSVTGCIKVEDLLDKKGIVYIANSDARSKGFIFGGNAKFKVNYLFFFAGLEVSTSDHVVVKNADATNIYNNNGSFKNYKVTDFSNGSLNASYTYKNKENSDSTKGVWAPYEVEISTKSVDYCWYVNTVGDLKGAKKIGSSNSVEIVRKDDENKDVKVTINTSVEEKYENGGLTTTLKVKNPTKNQSGLYFFCLVVSKSGTATYSFKETLDDTAINALSSVLNVSSGFSRLDVADNIVYHGVYQNGNEKGILFENWVVYGTDSKVKNNALFAANGGYIIYENDLGSVCDSGYVIPSYSYSSVDSGVSGVKFDGWMFFEDTVRNPNGIIIIDGYIGAYRAYFEKDSKIEYISYSEHNYWKFPKDGYSLTLDNTVGSLIYDTTINLYTSWEVPGGAKNLSVEIFVDEFGTTFMAKQAGDGYVYAPKLPNGNDKGENKFINDVMYVAVALDNAGTFSGKMQYAVGVDSWVDVDVNAAYVKTECDKQSELDIAKKWYSTNTEHTVQNVIYALEIDTNELLKKLEKTDEKGGIKSEFNIRFQYTAGGSSGDEWFDFLGNSVCGTFKFIPFEYHTLT